MDNVAPFLHFKGSLNCAFHLSCIQVTKNRFDGELGVMLLKFDKESLSFAVKEKSVKRLPKEEMDTEENPGLQSDPIEELEYPTEDH